ncbi:DedA family protein [Phaeovulum sp.]|uniref:DedA family protein n=1 Tax=Phaeovulum sp. TaxID=2934796 RepID=UPI00272F2E3D|nr:VTT domain-containing protein [Phaeovulum sp.]MDP1668321.1 VTT domain-containing protein [Phaeovulum sp.]MDZ4118169.1 VTT domain-containing protein [Phaeovulum sp.]
MTETLLALLPTWGPWLLATTTFLSCLMLPIPASMLMLAGGALVATGDLALPAAAGGALAGAIAGDQVGFFAGRGAGRFLPRLRGKRARAMARARQKLRRNGNAAVFFSRWLFAPLGPSVNVAAGALGHPHRAFTLAGMAGEVVWVGLYVGIGYAFGANLEAATELASSTLGLLAAFAALVVFGWWLIGAARRRGD